MDLQLSFGNCGILIHVEVLPFWPSSIRVKRRVIPMIITKTPTTTTMLIIYLALSNWLLPQDLIFSFSIQMVSRGYISSFYRTTCIFLIRFLLSNVHRRTYLLLEMVLSKRQMASSFSICPFGRDYKTTCWRTSRYHSLESSPFSSLLNIFIYEFPFSLYPSIRSTNSILLICLPYYVGHLSQRMGM